MILLNSHGKDAKRIEFLKNSLGQDSNAFVLELQETELEGKTMLCEDLFLTENLSPLTFIAQTNLLMNFLADLFGVQHMFKFGGKVTTVDDTTK